MKFTGFYPQGEEEREPPLDLARLLLRQPSAALFAVMVGEAMLEACIHDGDLLVIEAAADAYAHGQIVLGFVDGAALVRRLIRTPDHIALQPAHPNLPILELTADTDWLMRGRVLAAITLLAPPRFSLPHVH